VLEQKAEQSRAVSRNQDDSSGCNEYGSAALLDSKQMRNKA
jgi:hypothetical protein